MVFTVTALAEGDMHETLAAKPFLYSLSSPAFFQPFFQVFMYETHAEGAISTAVI